jgi:triphosphoribosyl-dephospho-CoA synthase
MNHRFSIGQCATLACLLEVAAPKPGNVHRGADFEDLTLEDYLTSAVAIAPAMDEAIDRPLGATVLAAVEATRRAVGRNTNLGTVLLLAPLAKAPRSVPLERGVAAVLASCGPEDARDVYAAIRLAAPGGLGKVDQYDVAGPPPDDLLMAMRAAAGRDMVARQYAEGFRQVLGVAAPWLRDATAQTRTLAEAIVHTFVRLLAEYPDSLIARKCGLATAEEAAARAARVLAAGSPGEDAYGRALADLDFWLRGDGHRRNPGTTADLIAAALFVGLRNGWIDTRRPFQSDAA